MQLHQQAAGGRAEQQQGAMAPEFGANAAGLLIGAATGEQCQHGGHIGQQADIESELVGVEELKDLAAALAGDASHQKEPDRAGQ